MTLDEIKSRCSECRRCELCDGRTNLVFGSGNENAEIMFVGEAPGEQEDLTGQPFVGRGGKLLDTMLVAAGISRSDVYIANILKCRPPKNRDPLPEEQDLCIDWLRMQFLAVKPKIIICLGRIAAKRLITPDIKITVDHGRIYKKGDIIMMATFHPAALLRNPNQKPLALGDLERALAYAGNRISE